MPPVIFITLAGNFLIDSIVLLFGLMALKASKVTGYSVTEMYLKTILQVWLCGFLADIMATLPLIIGIAGLLPINLPHEVENAIAMDPFSNIWALLIMCFLIMLAAALIYILNFKFSLKKVVADEVLRARLCIILALTTAPWTLLIPSNWLYRGF